MEFFATHGAKGHWGMGRGEEEDGNSRGEKVVVKDLNAVVHDAFVVEQRQVLDRFLGKADDPLRKFSIL